jgi:flagellar protein FlgJ
MIGPANDLSSKLALDTKGMSELKQSAQAGSPDALKKAATQFEAMFINMMMKSMRDATPADQLNDSQQNKMFTSMLDQQRSQDMAKKGIGLADMLIRQLSNQAGVQAQALAIGGDQNVVRSDSMPTGRTASELISTPGALLAPSNVGYGASGKAQAPHVRSFQEKLSAPAAEAERATGIPAKFMLGQAALETGWGKREIKNPDGSASNNLFGIKAGPGWTGKVASATTTEYVNGVPHTRVEKFRAYDTYADSFKDYAKLITSNPRYEKVLANAKDATGFAHGLQRAGYATDPLYAAKLTRIINHNLA